MKEQAAEAAEAAKKKAKKVSVKKVSGSALRVVWVLDVGASAAGVVYGRVRLHSPPQTEGAEWDW